MWETFHQKSCRNQGEEASSRPLFVFKKALPKVKACGQLSFNIFWWSPTWSYNKNKLFKTPDCWSRDFDFLKKGLGLVFHHLLFIIFQEKYLPCYILFTDQIWLLLLFEILGKMCIVVVYFSVYDVTNYEITFSFLCKRFSYGTKKVRT